MERKIPKVFNRYNKPRNQNISSAGAAIYEYDYLDYNDMEIDSVTKKQKPKLKKAKINVQEKIQSCLGLTDYKARIAAGEEILNDGTIGDGLRDFTSLPGDKADLIDFISRISAMDQSQIDELVKTYTTTETTTETFETTQQTEQDSTESDETTT